MVDTVRTLDELLTVIFASGQPAHSITEQDIRDAIVSLSLETGDFSGLPRSIAGLNIGRLWIDGNKALRVTSSFTPPNWSVTASPMMSSASLTANATVPGKMVYSVTATMRGAGVYTYTASSRIKGGSATLGGGGVITATPRSRIVGRATFGAAGAITAVPSSPAGGPFSTDFSTDFAISSVGGGGTVRSVNAQIAAGAGITATATPVSGTSWGAVAPSITRSSGNLTITRTGGTDGTSSTAIASQFRTLGNYYWEVVLAGGAQTSAVGFGNPSQPVIDGSTLINAGNTSISYYTYLGVGGLAIYNYGGPGSNYVQDLPGFTTSSNISFALKVGVGWWVRVDGGTWTGAGNAAGDPVAGTNPITAFCSTTGGLGPTAEVNVINQSQTLHITPTSWTYAAPSGFTNL